ncbi:hypothetical protein HGB07_03740, partial [Candidatus Roizmanbacteria bacterium]|nr:hypothetical protein [Candidatus Roizmanbacteria bacterium]
MLGLDIPEIDKAITEWLNEAYRNPTVPMPSTFVVTEAVGQGVDEKTEFAKRVTNLIVLTAGAAVPIDEKYTELAIVPKNMLEMFSKREEGFKSKQMEEKAINKISSSIYREVAKKLSDLTKILTDDEKHTLSLKLRHKVIDYINYVFGQQIKTIPEAIQFFRNNEGSIKNMTGEGLATDFAAEAILNRFYPSSSTALFEPGFTLLEQWGSRIFFNPSSDEATVTSPYFNYPVDEKMYKLSSIFGHKSAEEFYFIVQQDNQAMWNTMVGTLKDFFRNDSLGLLRALTKINVSHVSQRFRESIEKHVIVPALLMSHGLSREKLNKIIQLGPFNQFSVSGEGQLKKEQSEMGYFPGLSVSGVPIMLNLATCYGLSEISDNIVNAMRTLSPDVVNGPLLGQVLKERPEILE